MDTYFFSAFCVASALLAWPSRLAILPFISCFSISQAFRSRSCRCHSVCRKRITPCSVYSVAWGWLGPLPCSALLRSIPPMPLPMFEPITAREIQLRGCIEDSRAACSVAREEELPPSWASEGRQSRGKIRCRELPRAKSTLER
ncbi:hypothetical protein V8C26DRAFT_401218 [Trichoderma gracile]